MNAALVQAVLRLLLRHVSVYLPAALSEIHF